MGMWVCRSEIVDNDDRIPPFMSRTFVVFFRWILRKDSSEIDQRDSNGPSNFSGSIVWTVKLNGRGSGYNFLLIIMDAPWSVISPQRAEFFHENVLE